MTKEIETLWNNMIENSIATEQELDLATSLDGLSIETLQNVLYIRTGYHDWEQMIDD